MSKPPLMPCLRWFTSKVKTEREQILDESIQAMREFCRAVDDGAIHSRRTYAKFKAILARYDAL